MECISFLKILLVIHVPGSKIDSVTIEHCDPIKDPFRFHKVSVSCWVLPHHIQLSLNLPRYNTICTDYIFTQDLSVKCTDFIMNI